MNNPTTTKEHVNIEVARQDGTRRTQHDRESADEEHKPSSLDWMGLAILCVVSIVMISTFLEVKKVVIQIDSLAGFTQIKGSIIAIVGTIVHGFIGTSIK
jgi:hypothetical protein